jgi:type VI secretion system protein ImpK
MNTLSPVIDPAEAFASGLVNLPKTVAADEGNPETPSLKDLLEDGIYLVFLLRSENPPTSCAEFNTRVDQYLATFDRVCRTFGKSLDAVQHARYAFCAVLDEVILSSGMAFRGEWRSAPLQSRLFGEHLAGEGFFDRLDRLRQSPAENIELLEVFHTCLLLGFQGKYLLEGTEKLNYLMARLGQEIASIRGPGRGFAPSWKLPLKFNEYVRHELPVWLFFALLALMAVGVFWGCQWVLNERMNRFTLGSEAVSVSSSQTPESVSDTDSAR